MDVTVSTWHGGLSEALLLHIFEPPITLHRCLVPLTGSVTAALMLSQAIRATEELDSAACGWFTKSQEQWSEETGLTRWEQETARRILRSTGLLEEQRSGMPARLWFRVCEARLWEALRCHAGNVNGLRQG